MFAGTMIGVTLTFASLGGFLTPILTGFITDGNVIPPCSKDHRVAESTLAIQNATHFSAHSRRLADRVPHHRGTLLGVQHALRLPDGGRGSAVGDGQAGRRGGARQSRAFR